MSGSYTISVGINKFLDKKIPNLDFSVSDAYRIKRASYVLGFSKKATILLNEEAVTENIVKSFEQVDKKTDVLYFYISSHGNEIDHNFYVYTYDTLVSDLQRTALSMHALFDKLHRTNIKKIYLIIDACKIKLPKNISPRITVICPGKDITFEDTRYKQSLFTKAVLRFASQKKINQGLLDNTRRNQRIRQETFLLNQKHQVIYLYGASGLGKSHFLRELGQNEDNSYYISIPNVKGITSDIVLTLISEQISSIQKEKFYNTNDADPERYIRFFCNQNPHSLILIDHFDHLDALNAEKLLAFLETIPSEKLIASRIYPINRKGIRPYAFPALTKEDIDEVARCEKAITRDDKKSQEIYTKSNYIELLDFIDKYKKILPAQRISVGEINKVKKAIAITGGFIDFDRFSSFFQVDQGAIHQLINKGLIIKYESYYYPHDKIYDENIREEEVSELKASALHYWKQEIIHASTAGKALYNYILLLNTFSSEDNLNDIIFYKKVISLLKGKQHTYYLLILYQYFLNTRPPSDLKVHLCEALIEVGKFDEATRLLGQAPNENIALSLLSLELLWWKGQFQECIDAADVLLNQQPLEGLFHIYSSRGIAYFFLGKWSQASFDLKRAIELAPEEARKINYLSYCVLATIQGIRGRDFDASIPYFIEAIQIAKKEGKLSWIALIYGNIGEIFWKAGSFDVSKEILQTAQHLAYITDNGPLLLEINRNLLHAIYKSKDSEQVNTQIKTLEKAFQFESDNYVKMQIINTLITHYIFTKNPKYKKLLSIAYQLTKNNDEYFIYTLSNRAISTLIETKQDHSPISIMEQALQLCESGENWLAMKQCLDDWDQTLHVYRLTHPLSQQVFQKWHQVLQRKLLPNLHHLSHLYEYLQ